LPYCRSLSEAIDCSQQIVREKVPEFSPLVQLVTGSSIADQQKDQMLDALMSGGVSAVLCAIKAVEMDYARAPVMEEGKAAGGPEAMRQGLMARRAVDYTDRYLQKKKVAFSTPPQIPPEIETPPQIAPTENP